MRHFLILGALSGAVALAGTLAPYVNPRFGYQVQVGGDLRRLPPPDNGDGQAWESPDGQVRVAVWGSYAPDVLDVPTVNAYAALREKWEREAGSRVTYRRVLKDSFVLSGHLKDGRIFYQKTLVRGGREATARTEYPTARRATWDRRTVEITGTLKWVDQR